MKNKDVDQIKNLQAILELYNINNKKQYFKKTLMSEHLFPNPGKKMGQGYFE